MKFIKSIKLVVLLLIQLNLFSQVDINSESINIKSNGDHMIFSSDSTTSFGMSLYENEDFTISETNVAPRLILQKGGRVGINTLLPKSTLDVSFPMSSVQTEAGLILNASERKWRMTVGGDKAINSAHYQLLYRNWDGTTYTPKLTITHTGSNILGVGTNNPQATLDVAGSTKTESLSIENLGVAGQTRMLTVNQDGVVGSQVIPTSGTNTGSFLEVPILDSPGSANSITLANIGVNISLSPAFPDIQRNFRVQREVSGGSPKVFMQLNDNAASFNHANAGGYVMNINNSAATSFADGMRITLGTADNILNESNKFISFQAADNISGNPIEVGSIRGQQSISSLVNQVANSIFPDNPSSGDISGSSSTQNDVNSVRSRTSQPTSGDQGSQGTAINNLLQNETVVDALFMTMDFIIAVISNVTNLTGAIAGLGIGGDIDDAIWSGIELSNTIVQYASFLAFIDANEGISYESGNGDYAEWLIRANKDENIVAGHIVGVNGGEISKSFIDAERFMVISDQPFVLGNMPTENEGHLYEKVAFLGQVPVRVLGQVKKGDYILPSGNQDGFGIAVSPMNMKTKDYPRIVGVAWQESQKDQLISTINTAVGINANDIAYQIEKMQGLLNEMQSSLAELDPSFEAKYFDVANTSAHNDNNRTVSPTLKDMTTQSIVGSEMMDFSLLGNSVSKEQALNITKAHFQKAKQVIEQQGISLASFPYMEELFNDPSPETLTKVQTYYEGALDNVHNLLGQMNSGE